MDNLYSNITPQFGDNERTVQIKRAALQDYMHAKKSSPTLKAYGIDLNQFYPQAKGFTRR
jgi:hypothetical protein